MGDAGSRAAKNRRCNPFRELKMWLVLHYFTPRHSRRNGSNLWRPGRRMAPSGPSYVADAGSVRTTPRGVGPAIGI